MQESDTQSFYAAQKIAFAESREYLAAIIPDQGEPEPSRPTRVGDQREGSCERCGAVGSVTARAQGQEATGPLAWICDSCSP